jgi:AAHS family 4-hydroxybenzoate transporter-like MFS transporter
LYPSSILATGSGWASAIARIGAFIGPLVGGALIAAGVNPTRVIAGLAGPALICAFAMLALRTARQPIAAEFTRLEGVQ